MVIDSYSSLDSVFKVVILFLCRICSAGREVGIYVHTMEMVLCMSVCACVNAEPI